MKIYKYLNFQDGLKTLSNNSVLLNNPINYNDPFDCVIKPSKKDEDECYKIILRYYLFKEFSNIALEKKVKIPFCLLWVRWLMKIFKKMVKKVPYYDGMPMFDSISDLIIEKYSETNEEFKQTLTTNQIKFSKEIRNMIDEIKEMLLVSCFSKKYDSILMWSHYGDKHRGLCIEFEVDSDDFKEVIYAKKRKQIDLKTITAVVLGYDFIGEKVSKDNKKILKEISKLLFTKYKDWKYESELRVVHSIKDCDGENIFKKDERYFLKMPKINKVYVGCKANDDDLNNLKQDFPNVEIVVLKDSEKEFAIM